MIQYLTHPIFKTISDLASEMNMQAYLVGGYVRDILLNRPCKDIDIVVVGSGIELAQRLANADKAKPVVSIFKNFGTAMIKFENIEIEFVGARKESYRATSRKPIVENGTLEDDLSRRDFTINTLSISLQKNSFGEMTDIFYGLSDIEKKIIRTPLNADKTYTDDPLRMMRAIRFATQLNFSIEAKSLESIAKNKERIKIVSQERITDELNKIILSPQPSIGFKLLFNTGLLEIIFPQMFQLYGIERINNKAHKDNFYHTIKVLDNLSQSNNLWLRWAAILHDIAKPLTKNYTAQQGWTFHGHEDKGARMVPAIFRQLRLPLDNKMKFVQKMVRLHLRPIALVEDTVTDSGLRRLLMEAGDDIEELMLLCKADITSKNEKKVQQYLTNYKNVNQKLKEVEEKDRIRNWQPPITGKIIMDTFKIKPCKEVGIIKNTIREAILDGTIKNDYKEAFQLMLEQGEKIGLHFVNN